MGIIIILMPVSLAGRAIHFTRTRTLFIIASWNSVKGLTRSGYSKNICWANRLVVIGPEKVHDILLSKKNIGQKTVHTYINIWMNKETKHFQASGGCGCFWKIKVKWWVIFLVFCLLCYSCWYLMVCKPSTTGFKFWEAKMNRSWH